MVDWLRLPKFVGDTHGNLRTEDGQLFLVENVVMFFFCKRIFLGLSSLLGSLKSQIQGEFFTNTVARPKDPIKHTVNMGNFVAFVWVSKIETHEVLQ